MCDRQCSDVSITEIFFTYKTDTRSHCHHKRKCPLIRCGGRGTSELSFSYFTLMLTSCLRFGARHPTSLVGPQAVLPAGSTTRKHHQPSEFGPTNLIGVHFDSFNSADFGCRYERYQFPVCEYRSWKSGCRSR